MKVKILIVHNTIQWIKLCRALFKYENESKIGCDNWLKTL